ncbi:histidine phosphatase family protein [Rhodobacteraceae bacterium B1Z28]|uniref:Histidine phosphatase family protein n=1 Tax=Ruegeria haliotis TaxID=2747601 RepID=A0ABX2PYY2_9RHOB|nr:phosphoglycerate mutase family protein [Ruegeria haliotis]NVO58204.1 histidine phosphatase family protein [Ruegeria haliotis]
MLRQRPILTRRFPVHKILPTPVMRRRYALRLWTATIILVRHADIAPGGADPSLSAAGQARAELLRDMLQDEGIRAVFVTNTNRSRQTGTPTATAVGVVLSNYPALDAAWLAARVRSHHAGQTVLVVAHSNTVDDIAAAFGASGVLELAEHQFDRMFVISRAWCTSRLVSMRFGAPTP